MRRLIGEGYPIELAAIAVETIHGMEPEVLCVAEDLIEFFALVPERAKAALAARSHRGVEEATDGLLMSGSGLSWPRKHAAVILAARAAGVARSNNPPPRFGGGFFFGKNPQNTPAS